MRNSIWVALILAAGVAIGLVIASILDAFHPDFGKLDVTALMVALLGIAITGITIVGGFTIVNTWNDIDRRAKQIVERHYEEATERMKRDQEERQRQIDETAMLAEQKLSEMVTIAQHYNKRGQVLLGALSIVALILLFPWKSRKGIIDEVQEWLQKKGNKG